ncbi:hypothetical protein ACOMHN_058540 [Nucella lapillus]
MGKYDICDEAQTDIFDKCFSLMRTTQAVRCLDGLSNQDLGVTSAIDACLDFYCSGGPLNCERLMNYTSACKEMIPLHLSVSLAGSRVHPCGWGSTYKMTFALTGQQNSRQTYSSLSIDSSAASVTYPAMFYIAVIALGLALHAGAEVPEGRVVNGVVVDPPNSFPWQLSLQRGTSHICGAVVYDSNYVITAAHCVHRGVASNYRVACGGHDLYVYEAYRQTVGVAAITVHPNYNPNGNGFPNDIAVLRLSSPLTLNAKCQAAKLDTGLDFSFSPAVITGWGRLSGGGNIARQLKRGEVEVLPHSTCRNYWQNTINAQYHICVKDIGDKYFGACNGDSGGPAQVGDTVIGLASFVARGCLPQYPSAYVRISTYISWIDSTVSNMS